MKKEDIPVALLLSERPESTYASIAATLGMSVSTAHKAVARLRASGLIMPSESDEKRVNRLSLLEFLEHGVRYAFPAHVGATVRGVPTSHVGPVLARMVDPGNEFYVWPSATGTARGQAIAPLLRGAAALVERAPDLYATLTLVDAIRLGRARERLLAKRELRARLGVGELRFT